MGTPYQRIEEDLRNDVLNTGTLKRPFKARITLESRKPNGEENLDELNIIIGK
ncbi:MAG TPA: hypothetical protein VK462_06475 [Nitrososphaeraceae archaeon]|nr:hypothetical protein [Nitrososphaeraceae archaeon]